MPLHESPVSLVDFSLAQHLVEARERLGGLGEYHHTSDRAVEAMHYPAKYITGFVVFLLEVSLDGFG